MWLGGLALVDTPGLSPRDDRGLTRLHGFLRAARPNQVHLTIPATTKTEDALAVVRAYAPLGVTHLCLTRLDESGTCGSLITVRVASGLPVSYLGTGREIPHDIRPATARDLARRALGGDQQP